MSDITDRTDFYEFGKPELEERTRRRLTEIEKCGMKVVGIAEFGYKGVMSGLYIEYVWSYSDEKFNDYMEWAKGLIAKHLEAKNHLGVNDTTDEMVFMI